MSKFLIVATLEVGYEVPIEAEDSEAALAMLDEWIDQDFEPYQKDACWNFDVLEIEEEDD